MCAWFMWLRGLRVNKPCLEGEQPVTRKGNLTSPSHFNQPIYDSDRGSMFPRSVALTVNGAAPDPATGVAFTEDLGAMLRAVGTNPSDKEVERYRAEARLPAALGGGRLPRPPA